MDTYIVRVYRRDIVAKALTGRVEHVGSESSCGFDAANELWAFLLRAPEGGGSKKPTGPAERRRAGKVERSRRRG